MTRSRLLTRSGLIMRSCNAALHSVAAFCARILRLPVIVTVAAAAIVIVGLADLRAARATFHRRLAAASVDRRYYATSGHVSEIS